MTRTRDTDEPAAPRRITDDVAEPSAEASQTILVDGEQVALRTGESVAACLLGNGRLAWRTTRIGGRPRGVFCGIGACFDCLVTVNGTPGIRACRYIAKPGDEIGTGTAEPAAPAPDGAAR